MNQTFLIGRTCQDIELKSTQNNVPVCSFTLAVTRDYKNQNDEYDSDFIQCVAYRKTAELIAKYVSKGNRLAVTGRIQTRNYDNEQGNKVYVTEVIVDKMEFLEPKKEDTPSEVTPVETKPDPFAEFGASIAIEDDDLPF